MQNRVKIIWLDDERDPFGFVWNSRIQQVVHESITYENYPQEIRNKWNLCWVKNYDEFVKELESWKNDEWLIICFDHDLGKEKTGYDCAKFLVQYLDENHYPIPYYHIQSSNVAGLQNIESYIESYRKSLQ